MQGNLHIPWQQTFQNEYVFPFFSFYYYSILALSTFVFLVLPTRMEHIPLMLSVSIFGNYREKLSESI